MKKLLDLDNAKKGPNQVPFFNVIRLDYLPT